MTKNFHGSHPAKYPLALGHLSISIVSKAGLSAFKDMLEEASWDYCDIIKAPAMVRNDPLPVATKGALPHRASGLTSPIRGRPNG